MSTPERSTQIYADAAVLDIETCSNHKPTNGNELFEEDPMKDSYDHAYYTLRGNHGRPITHMPVS